MGISFRHENSMLEDAESLRFTSPDVNPDLEMGSAISFANQKSRRDSDDIDFQFSNNLDIQLVER